MKQLDKIDSKRISNVLQIIKNSTVEEDYFFNKLRNSQEPFEWLVPLKDEDYFNPAKNPIPIKTKEGFYKVPSWNVLGFLENVAKKNIELKILEAEKIIIEFIEGVIAYRDEYGKRIENSNTDFALVKLIFLLPPKKIKLRYIDFVSTAIKSGWGQSLILDELHKSGIMILVNNKMKTHVLRLLKRLIEYRKSNEKYSGDEYYSILDRYHLKRIMDAFRIKFAQACKNDAVELIEKTIKGILKKDEAQFNLIWIPHIKEHKQNHFTDRYELQLIFLFRECLIACDDDYLYNKVKSYLSDIHPIFRRMAFHLINNKYDLLSDLLWNLPDNPLEYPSVKHELYPLFENHSHQFDTEQLNKAISWIENKDYSYIEKSEVNENIKVKQKAYRKKEWLNALLPSGNKSVVELFQRYDLINPAVLERPGIDYWMEDSTWNDETTSEKELAIFKETNADIVKHLNKCRENEKSNSDRYDLESYSSLLRGNIIETPEKYYSDLFPFLKADACFQNIVIQGLAETWRLNKLIDWTNTLEFVHNLICTKEFNEVRYVEDQINYRDRIIVAIADLISEGTRRDDHAFDPDLLPLAKNILLILEHNSSAEINFHLDLATSMLNAVKARIYDSLINYCLRFARIFNSDKVKRIEDDILDLFNKKLEISEDKFFFYTVGKFMANFLWLDKTWIIENVPKIFPLGNQDIWRYSFSGYLFYSSHVNKDLFLELKSSGNLKNAFSYSFKDIDLNQTIINHFCISFVNRWENLDDDDSMIRLTIASRDLKKIKTVAHFLWSQKEYILTQPIENEIHNLFYLIYDEVKTLDKTEELNDVYSELSKWLVFFKSIDVKALLAFKYLVSIPLENYNVSEVFEELDRLARTSPIEVADILIVLFTNAEEYFFYEKEPLISIIHTLDQYGHEQKKIELCNALIAKKQYEFKQYVSTRKNENSDIKL